MRYFEIEHDGETWEYSFSEAIGIGNEEDREYFIRETIKLYKDGKKRRTIKGKTFEGQLVRGNFHTVGIISGRYYSAQLETEKGNKTASLVVMKSLDSILN